MLSAENSGKPLGGRGSARTPLGELTAPSGPIPGWEGDCCSFSETPLPAVGLRPSVLPLYEKITDAPLNVSE